MHLFIDSTCFVSKAFVERSNILVRKFIMTVFSCV